MKKVDIGNGLTAVPGFYSHGIPALQIYNEYGSLEQVATVNLIQYGIVPDPDNIIIKEADENKGMIDKLTKAGIISEKLQAYSYGFITDGAWECALTDLGLEMYETA